jgi:hypothetical protein
VIAQHRHRWNLQGAGDLPRERPCFIGQTVVGKIAADHQHVGVLGCLGEKRL